MSGNKSYLDEPQDTGFKRIITNSFKKNSRGLKKTQTDNLMGLKRKNLKRINTWVMPRKAET